MHLYYYCSHCIAANHLIIIILTLLQELDVQTDYFVYTCSPYQWIRSVIVTMNCLNISILQVLALYLSFHIRKVKVKGLNDAKYTAIIVCISAVLAIVLVIVYFMLIYLDYESYGIFLVFREATMWIFATAVLLFMFIPKVHDDYKYAQLYIQISNTLMSLADGVAFQGSCRNKSFHCS